MSELAESPTDMPSDALEEKEDRQELEIERRLDGDVPSASRDPLRRYFYEARNHPKLWGVAYLAPHDCYVRHRLAYERLVDEGLGQSALAQAHKHQYEAVRAFVVTGARLIVLHMAHKRSGIQHKLDALQEGNLGVMEALDHYDPDHVPQTSFPTFVRFWIRQSINRSRENSGKTVREPVHFQERRRKVERFRWVYHAQHGSFPSEELIIKTVLMPEKDEEDPKVASRRLKQLREVHTNSATMMSLSRPMSDEEQSVTFQDMLSLPSDLSPESHLQLVQTYTILDQAWQRVRLTLRFMKPMLQTTLRHRLGIDDTPVLTLAALGQQFNLSRERVRQLEQEAYRLIGLRIGLSKDDVPLIFLARSRVAHLLGLPGGRAFDPTITEHGWDFEAMDGLLTRLEEAGHRSLSAMEERFVQREAIDLKSKVAEIEEEELERREFDKNAQDEVELKRLEKERQKAEKKRQGFLERYGHWRPASSPTEPPLPWTVTNRPYPFAKRDGGRVSADVALGEVESLIGALLVQPSP